MAGHSKFKNIQHRKGAQDKKRAKIFTKVGREITVASKMGGDDPEMNPRLRLAIQSARAVNMPKDRIKRAIEQGSGGSDDANYEEMRYEGYAPGGVAVIVEALTDNKNRSAGDIRAIFSKNGGNMGETNSVSFMFDRVGEIVYQADVTSAEDMFEKAVEAGAENVESDEEVHEIITAPDDFASVKDSLEAQLGSEAEKASLAWRPNVSSDVDEETARKVIKLIDALEDNDDVQNVTTNFDASDEIMEKIMADEG